LRKIQSVAGISKLFSQNLGDKFFLYVLSFCFVEIMLKTVNIANVENFVGKIHYFFEEVISFWKEQAFSALYEK
jgi:hypothetical protein